MELHDACGREGASEHGTRRPETGRALAAKDKKKIKCAESFRSRKLKDRGRAVNGNVNSRQASGDVW